MENGKMVLHYGEYGEGDFEIEITANLMVSYYQFLGYPRSKANLIVGGIEKLKSVASEGFTHLVADDERFVEWATEFFRKQARKAFGFEGYLLALMEDGVYVERKITSFQEANKAFDREYYRQMPCALFLPSVKGGGWNETPIRRSEWNRIKRAFYNKHVNARKYRKEKYNG